MSKVKGPLGLPQCVDRGFNPGPLYSATGSSTHPAIHFKHPLFVLSPGLYEGGNESISVLVLARSKSCFLMDVS